MPVSQDFDLDAALEGHRRELTGYCYRMLGAGHEAEDAVQETLVRAWRASDRFEGRSSVRSWLYRIATNVCIDMHRAPQRRARPMEMRASTTTARADLSEQLPEHAFVQPVLDERVLPDGDPSEVAAARETVRLAFVAALQHLPPRQRAVLVLREVLAWSAEEVAELLDTSVASVNSALQRARDTMARRRAEPLDVRLDARHEELLDRYMDAFQRYDVSELVSLMRDDAVMSMPPFPMWLQGPAELAAWFTGPGSACEGSRLIAVAVNGTGGFASYKQKQPGVWEPFAIQVIEVADGRLVGHHNFLYPELFEQFGLPARLEA